MDSVLTELSIEFRLLSEKNTASINAFLNKHLDITNKFKLIGLNTHERYLIYSSIGKTIKFKKTKNKTIIIERNDGVDTFSESSNELENTEQGAPEENENIQLLPDKTCNSECSDSEFSNSIEINNDNIFINYSYILNEIKNENRIWFTVLVTINLINLFIQISNYSK